ncbi:hypothetical protein Neosp_004144 [[Neocosmospora] mangrovei]
MSTPSTIRQQQTLFDAISADTHVTQNRAPNTPIRRPYDLTTHEKLRLVDLVERYRSMRDPSEDEEADIFDLWDQFMREIFKRWSSNRTIPSLGKFPDRKFDDANIQVGVLKENHPESGAGGQPGPHLPTSEARVAGAPRDANCQFINPRYVELQNNMTRMQARCLAVENYDANEADRIINWNNKVVVNAARRRIVRWAAAGSQPEMIIHRDDLLGPDDIKSLVLASDYIEQERRGLEELSQCLRDLIPASNFDFRDFRGVKRALALARGLHVKTEKKPNPDEDGDIIFVGTNSISSARVPGNARVEAYATTMLPPPALPLPLPLWHENENPR